MSVVGDADLNICLNENSTLLADTANLDIGG